jgi:TonB family protein
MTAHPAQGRRGELSKEAVRRAIHRGMNSVRECWERALTRDLNVATRMSVRFVIDPHGRVASAERVGPSTGDPALDQCVLKAVEAFVFPAPSGDGSVTVTFPFIVDTAGG